MFALVESGSITKYFSGNKGITIEDNQYPKAIFTLWSKDDREAIGIYEIEIDNTNKKDEAYYNNTNQFLTLQVEKLQQAMAQQQLKLMLILYSQHKMNRMEKVQKVKLKLED